VQRLLNSKRALAIGLVAIVIVITVAFAWASGTWEREPLVPSFKRQACSVDPDYLLRTQRGYYEPRSGQIAILPKEPAYMASGAGGWSHSGPWPYLQEVPLVLYGPGIIKSGLEVDRPVTIADLAPTTARLLGDRFGTDDSRVLREASSFKRKPKLVLTIVWDGGGWNTLDLWPDSWPNLQRMMADGVSYTNATVGSNPSVTPAVHTTLGTGVFPWRHGITGVPVRDEEGEVVDSFLEGESSRFVQAETFAERWDVENGNSAEVAMFGYEPWHLGMIGQGAERQGGDKDDGVWLDIETNEWKTNPDHYSLPSNLVSNEGLGEFVAELDGEDGQADDSWRDDVPLDDPAREEETPAFVRYHTQAMLEMISSEGYGRDGVSDLVYTNYKQIDRVGHYFNMDSAYVDDVLRASDEQLPLIFDGLDRIAGEGNWVVALTADHGQQRDEGDIGGFGISPREIEGDIRSEFGDVVRAVWPTEVFLEEDELEANGVTVDEVARFLGGYTLGDNAPDVGEQFAGSGEFDSTDRIFELAIPSRRLPGIECEPPKEGGRTGSVGRPPHFRPTGGPPDRLASAGTSAPARSG
jgi:arylsulfatase A-like enzyme